MRVCGVIGIAGLLTLANMGCQGTLPVRPHRPLRAETVPPVESDESSGLLPVMNRRQTSAGEIVLTSAEVEVPSETADSLSGLKAAERRDPISLLDLETIAFESNPTLSAATARMQAARGKQVQAGLYPNPVIGYDGTQIGNLGTAGQQGGFISQRFITGGKLKLDQAIAGKEVE